MKSQLQTRRATLARSTMAVAVAVGWGFDAMAIDIDTGNEDITVRWDNTVRYNLGMRMEGQDKRLLGNSAYDESDSRFNRGSVVTNRVDLLSEADVNYRSVVGARVSGSAWYDNAYDSDRVRAPAGALTSYYNDRYNSSVSRYVHGPSGELLDAFVWTNANLGVVPVNVKVGRHAIVWGEGLLLGAHAVSYSQAPTDGVKAVTSPGIETKEVVLPLNQVSFKAQITDSFSLAGQYFLQWDPTRVPNGGTYLMGADTSPNVDRLPLGGPFAYTALPQYKPNSTGNWGLAARFNIEAIESTLGLYYRQFDDYNPETGIELLPTGRTSGNFRFTYAQNVKLIGLSFARGIGGVSFGSDLSLRKNGHLNSAPTYVMRTDGARGDTLHWVMNGVYLLPKTLLWDTGNLIAEVGYSRLLSITENADLYRGVGYASCTKAGVTPTVSGGDKIDACSTRNAVQTAINFTPQYLNLLPSWDLDLPMSVNYGLAGTSAAGGGGFYHALTWAVGAKMTYSQKHEFTLRYSDIRTPTKYVTDAAGTRAVGGSGLGSIVGATDRGWLVFTYKTSF